MGKQTPQWGVYKRATWGPILLGRVRALNEEKAVRKGREKWPDMNYVVRLSP